MVKNTLLLSVLIFTLALVSCNNGSSSSSTSSNTLISISITPESATINLEGGSQQFNAIGTFSDNTSMDITESVIWSSDNESIAITSNESGSSGFTIGTGVGSTNIKAKFGGIIASSKITITPIPLTSIDVTPESQTLPIDISQHYIATGHYEDGLTHDITKTVEWSSSATNIASINKNGIATGIAPGHTNIVATFHNISGTANLVISSVVLISIYVTPFNQSLDIGSTQQYKATGVLSDQSSMNLTHNVTWTSSNTSVATINTNGIANAIKIGDTTIMAKLNAISGTTLLNVK